MSFVFSCLVATNDEVDRLVFWNALFGLPPFGGGGGEGSL
jgi:hypothetical protein